MINELEQNRHTSFYMKANMCETVMASYELRLDNKSEELFITFFNKRKKVMKKILDMNAIDEYNELIRGSKLVVFHSHEECILVKTLINFCKRYHCYGPIVKVEKNDIYFFPQLDYGDAYLIKDLFQNKFVNQEISVFFGETTV